MWRFNEEAVVTPGRIEEIEAFLRSIVADGGAEGIAETEEIALEGLAAEAGRGPGRILLLDIMQKAPVVGVLLEPQHGDDALKALVLVLGYWHVSLSQRPSKARQR